MCVSVCVCVCVYVWGGGVKGVSLHCNYINGHPDGYVYTVPRREHTITI